MDSSRRTIGYVLKGYGRTSETFISNEIALLEEAGMSIHVFSLKRLTNELAHGVTQRIGVPVNYAPEPASGQALNHWSRWSKSGLLAPNWQRLAGAHRLVWRKRPLAWLRTLGGAVWLGLRCGRQTWRPLVREFLQAGWIAAELLERKGESVAHLHSHFAHTATTVTWFAARLSGLPFSFTAHAKDIYRTDMNPGDLLARKLRAASFTVTCTQANADHLRQVAGKDVKIHRVYHGIDLELFGGREISPPTSPHLILAVGRFVEKKGFPDLIEACRILRDQGLEFQTMIVGGFTPLTAEIDRLVDRYDLTGRVSLHPAMTQEELARIYTRATIFALPCLITDDGDRDGIPNVLVEAMASGLAVVSTRVSGIPELVRDGETGRLVRPRDVTALAGAICELLADGQLRARLGRSGRQLVQRDFDARGNTARLRQLFEEALAGAAR